MKRTEHTQKWLDALRSGDYEQTRGILADGDGYCCLGVAGKVAGLHDEEMARHHIDAYIRIGKAIGMDIDERSVCIDMNDMHCKTFPEIADAIEQMLDDN